MTTQKASAKAAKSRPTRFSISRNRAPSGVVVVGAVSAGSTGTVVVAAGSTGTVAGSTGTAAGSVTTAGSVVVVVSVRSASVGDDGGRSVRDRAVGQPLGGGLGVGGLGVEVMDGIRCRDGQAQCRRRPGDPLVREPVGDPGAHDAVLLLQLLDLRGHRAARGAEAETDDVQGDDAAEQQSEDDDPGPAPRHADDEAGIGDPPDRVDRQHRDVDAARHPQPGAVVACAAPSRRPGGPDASPAPPSPAAPSRIGPSASPWASASASACGRAAGRVRGETAGAPISPRLRGRASPPPAGARRPNGGCRRSHRRSARRRRG